MMLHEAVMLEIYRQALNASELASPRCHSRESNISGVTGDGRCPSNDSQCSGNENATPVQTPFPMPSPIGLPLPATLAPAGALLPPQSAAMAAYLNAAAAAAQQNHLLLSNPLVAAASLVQQTAQSHSPHSTALDKHPSISPLGNHTKAGVENGTAALDFSTKHLRRDSANCSDVDDADELRHKRDTDADQDAMDGSDDANSPLDLSIGSARKREGSYEEGANSPKQKIMRLNELKSVPAGAWVPPINPYLAAAAAASLSPKSAMDFDWNIKHKSSPNEATKALERMTEMARIGTTTSDKEYSPVRKVPTPSSSTTSTTSNSVNNPNGRHSAWQSHWLNKGADAVKDVFKCVWCKQSFPTLASLTVHMKETQHCGVNGSSASNMRGSINENSSGNHQAQSSQHSRHGNANSNAPSPAASNKSDLNLLIKETMPLPRKLVRGQDVWLGKGAEQTRQILKCMWCGQSFRSLAEMTSHMQETQHYTNIISQEQIISWKSTDDKGSNGNGSAAGGLNAADDTASSVTPPAMHVPSNSGSSGSTVSAVLTCKVCDTAFSTLKELSNHMVKNNHYTEHIVRTGESNQATPKRGRQAREKRKKSLPVRKLLEIERAQQDSKCNSLDPALKPLRDFAASTKISCEKCGEKIETALFVEHIRQCLGGCIPIPSRKSNQKPSYVNLLNTEPLLSPNRQNDHRRLAEESSSSASTTRSEIFNSALKMGEKASTPSVLNAIEQLIEKSFDTKSRLSMGSGAHGNPPLGSSILKRLGIEDTVDYTKPLMSLETMNFLRSYSSCSGRNRSASESSSVSERCSSQMESHTPERNSEISRQATPCLTPDKLTSLNDALRKDSIEAVRIKTEPTEVGDGNSKSVEPENETPIKISVKKEFNLISDRKTFKRNNTENKRDHLRAESRPLSPNISERSTTPKSTSSIDDKKMPMTASSLNALSSMFDNLNNTNTNALANVTNGENNNNTIGKKPNCNPLAALQKLCENNDTPPAANTRSGGHLVATTTVAVNDGSSNMAFNWTTTDGATNCDTTIKCSFCDTTFISKANYRHHLTKVHMLKGDAETDSQSSGSMKSPVILTSPKSQASPKSTSKSPAAQQPPNSPSAGPPASKAMPTINPYDESTQSKFLKYTELAKQLSSKNA